jgi:hypothetical protein
MSIGIVFYRLAIVLKTEIGNKNKDLLWISQLNPDDLEGRAKSHDLFVCLSVCLFVRFVGVCLLYLLSLTPTCTHL